ncbi:hypothetical protein GCM10007368_03030 [Isoptericola cucumis]|uniref:Uncharacterized protein n=1 Tax=Isoptericola cucumis TaxID=1776856 RepID=A0ABQ2B0B2_9MICO|nr:hypothetical protein GCM10007368_03030 [Isoptericola cucumis]
MLTERGEHVRLVPPADEGGAPGGRRHVVRVGTAPFFRQGPDRKLPGNLRDRDRTARHRLSAPGVSGRFPARRTPGRRAVGRAGEEFSVELLTEKSVLLSVLGIAGDERRRDVSPLTGVTPETKEGRR